MLDARETAEKSHELLNIERDGPNREWNSERRQQLVEDFARMRYQAQERTGRDMHEWLEAQIAKATRRLGGDKWHVRGLIAAGDILAVRDLEIQHRNNPLRRAAYSIIQDALLYYHERVEADVKTNRELVTIS